MMQTKMPPGVKQGPVNRHAWTAGPPFPRSLPVGLARHGLGGFLQGS